MLTMYYHRVRWRYGMVWYGMIWYGMVGMVCYVMVWYGMIWYGMVWYGMVWYDMVWYGMVWYGMVWYDMVWYDMVREGVVCSPCINSCVYVWPLQKVNCPSIQMKMNLTSDTRTEVTYDQQQSTDTTHTGSVAFEMNIDKFRVLFNGTITYHMFFKCMCICVYMCICICVYV